MAAHGLPMPGEICCCARKRRRGMERCLKDLSVWAHHCQDQTHVPRHLPWRRFLHPPTRMWAVARQLHGTNTERHMGRPDQALQDRAAMITYSMSPQLRAVMLNVYMDSSVVCPSILRHLSAPPETESRLADGRAGLWSAASGPCLASGARPDTLTSPAGQLTSESGPEETMRRRTDFLTWPSKIRHPVPVG